MEWRGCSSGETACTGQPLVGGGRPRQGADAEDWRQVVWFVTRFVFTELKPSSALLGRRAVR